MEVTYKTAWFLAHRIRGRCVPATSPPFGGAGGEVEADKTYIGRDALEPMRHGGHGHKMKALSLIWRETGEARSFVVTSKEIGGIVAANISREAHPMTDKSNVVVVGVDETTRPTLALAGAVGKRLTY